MRVLTQSEPIALSMIMAAALHAALILGLGFVAITRVTQVSPTLEVILVQSSGGETPEDASYLAQVSQDGGGNTDDRERPTTPFQGTERIDTNGVSPIPLEASAPTPQETEEETILTQLFSEYAVATQETSKPKAETKPKLKISEFDVDANLEMARLSAEVDEMLNQYAERPRKEFISARTKEASAAAYMLNWVEQVERIGNLNYPGFARTEGLSGRLLLTVGINKNGSIASIDLRQSSGVPALDEAAKDIVKLAAPFKALEGELRKRTDILYIARTWEFDSESGLSSEK